LVPLPLALVTAPSSAFAKDDDDDEDEDEDEDDEGGDEDEDDEQPPVTAGGLFTKKTWPTAELERPLTILGGMAEVRAGIDFDVSKGTAFEIFFANLDVKYGLKDWVELQAGGRFGLAAPEGVTLPTSIYFGIEGAIAYDLANIRLLAEMPLDPKFKFDLVFGVPFRYKVKPNIAIIALDKILTIHTGSVAPAGGGEEEFEKPDLTIGVGIIFQATPQLAVLARGEIILAQVDPDLIAIPATIAAQFSPNNKVDIGLEARLANVKPETRFDQRSAGLFAQFRF
jgi:hypothetical protein